MNGPLHGVPNLQTRSGVHTEQVNILFKFSFQWENNHFYFTVHNIPG